MTPTEQHDVRPLSPEELAEISEWHTLGHRVTSIGTMLYCTGTHSASPCQGAWPCHVLRLALEVERQRSALEGADVD